MEALGYAGALGSAASWALASILFARLGADATPRGMNLFKCLAGTVYLGVAVLLAGSEPMGTRDFLFLGLSGLLGIALGDTLFFASLVRLGPRPVVLLGMLGPVFTLLGSAAFLGERMDPQDWAGCVLVLGGVVLVLWPAAEPGSARPGSAGVLYGLGAALCMSAGILLAKVGVGEVGALQGTLVRMAWAAVGLLPWAFRDLAPFRDGPLLRRGLGAVTVVIFGGFWLSLVGLKHLTASVATVLNATEPLFVLPLSALLLGQRVRPLELAGAAAAVVGVALLVLGWDMFSIAPVGPPKLQ